MRIPVSPDRMRFAVEKGIAREKADAGRKVAPRFQFGAENPCLSSLNIGERGRIRREEPFPGKVEERHSQVAVGTLRLKLHADFVLVRGFGVERFAGRIRSRNGKERGHVIGIGSQAVGEAIHHADAPGEIFVILLAGEAGDDGLGQGFFGFHG